ncbi:Ig-like domain-containing protein [Thalassotalea litorea]|uniref:Ig-like domain-containing protein n=1 Tax=Thalassotalea litorea TaxID=2020715 RepID=UPI0037356215
MKKLKWITLLAALGIEVVPAYANQVKVDVNLNIKHEVNGVSDFNRKKHITVHSALTESDWHNEAETMNYLMNDLDVYFGRDNGMASWIFKATAQDPNTPGRPHIEDLANFGQWHKDNMYDNLAESLRAYEDRSDEMIMGITPHGPFPTQSYWEKDLAGKDDEAGKYVLRHIDYGAEWVGEYLDQFMRKSGETSGVLMPKYWEVINEPDMDINVGRTFVMSSFEQLFEYHNLVADQIKTKLPESERPLIGGMTWGLHDLENGDLSERFPTQDRAVRSRYAYEEGDLEDFLQAITSSEYWVSQDDKYFQWDAIWKGFMDASGHNMDFYSLHLYDWAHLGDDPRQGSTFRRGMKTEAILDMVEWYDAQVNGADNLKPWVISEYGAIASKHGKLEFLENDYRYSDWLHLRTFNQMFMQILTRPSQVVKSMPFAPIKAKWGLLTGPNGEAIRYEAALMHTDEALSANYDTADWYVTDKIQWYELWSDVKGTRIDTHSSDPDVQVDAYVDGNHTYLILNNLEWYNIPVDLSFIGANNNNVVSVNMKHSYLAEGLSPTNLGRPILAEARMDTLPESVTLEPGSTIILDIEYHDEIAITSTMTEKKFYGESLSGAGKGEAAKGQVHRILGTNMTGNINNVVVPKFGEARLRIAAEFYPFHASKPANNTFTINGYTIDVPTQVNANASGLMTEHYDYMGPEVDETSVSLNLIDIPVPLEYLQQNNEVTATVASARAFTAISLSIWSAEQEIVRSANEECDTACTIPYELTITGESSVLYGETIKLTANVLPLNAENKNVIWSTSDVKVAAVDQNGLVTATGTGSATISAITAQGMLESVHDVNVVAVAPTHIEITPVSVNLALHETLKLNATITPNNATIKAITWHSSNDEVVSVDNNGLITALANGVADITVTTVDGNVSDVVTVSVASVPLESINLASNAVIVLPGTYQAKVDFIPSNATDTSVTWQSDNYTIATVDADGLITGVAPGATTITITSTDGNHSQDIIVNVIEASSIPSDGFVVEAETMTATGGIYDGFTASSVGINNNQTGDWAEYQVNFPEAGVYQLTLDAGTPTAPVNGASVYVNGVNSGSAEILTSGDWDVMLSNVISQNVLISSAGTHTIRIESVGAAGKWQWNADKLTFTLLSPLDPELAPELEPESPTDPDVPASLTLHNAQQYLNTDYIVGDVLSVFADYHAGTNQTVTSENGGVKFYLREMTSSWSLVNDYEAFDASAIDKESGVASANISLANLTPSADLPAGNFYFLFASFVSSDGQTYKIPGVSPITILADGENEPEEPTEPEIPSEPGIGVDDESKYLTSVFAKGGNINLTAVFSAGTGNTVVESAFGGVNGGLLFIIQELRADGSQVKRVVVGDSSSIGQQSGTLNISLPLVHPTQGDLKLTSELNAGHYYNLTARFKSSDGSTQILPGISPIIIGEVASSTDPEEPMDPEEPSDPDTPTEPEEPNDNGGLVDGDAFTIEAESFNETGGRVAGVTIGERGIPTDRRTVTDSNQNGDWVDYYIEFPSDGFYRIEMVASSQNANSQAATYVDGVLVDEVPVFTGNQGIFENFVLADSVFVTAGVHTVRIEATSAAGNGWMWFGDTVTFTHLIADTPNVESSFSFANKQALTSTVFTVGGELVVETTFEAGSDNVVSDAFAGIEYMLMEMTADLDVVNTVSVYDGDAIGQQTGTSAVTMSLAGLTPSNALSSGNYYYLVARFDRSVNGEQRLEGISPIIIESDFDQDGIADSLDTDDDNDGVEDLVDTFPMDDTEWIDTDGDGTGNNADTDDDNDNVDDVSDAFPLDASESLDTDNDGIGNNTDTDDDNDGVADILDAFPLDNAESADFDGDRIGDNRDTDDDNDGVKDDVDEHAGVVSGNVLLDGIDTGIKDRVNAQGVPLSVELNQLLIICEGKNAAIDMGCGMSNLNKLRKEGRITSSEVHQINRVLITLKRN